MALASQATSAVDSAKLAAAQVAPDGSRICTDAKRTTRTAGHQQLGKGPPSNLLYKGQPLKMGGTPLLGLAGW